MIEEALRSDIVISDVFVSERASQRAADLVQERGTIISKIANLLFDTISETKSPQGIIALAKRPKFNAAKFDRSLEDCTLAIYLHEINDPSNLGAIFRTAEAAGVKGIIISKNSADAFSGKANRAAMGANLRLTIRENADFKNVLDWAMKNNLKTTAAAASGKTSHFEIDWKLPRLLIFGSEAHGLPVEIMENVDETVFIPMEQGVESLNLAVSCGILLFAARTALLKS